MKNCVVYVHGKGGNAGEARQFEPLFPDRDVIGMDYRAENPWEAKEEFSSFFAHPYRENASVWLIANSIGAYFAMHALAEMPPERAFLISPIVDMERLILDLMRAANVTEDELRERRIIPTATGEPLSWEYLCYIRAHPIVWRTRTAILYGERDNLTSPETVSEFAAKTGAELTVMPGGEHWFHTPEQLRFLRTWLHKTTDFT